MSNDNKWAMFVAFLVFLGLMSVGIVIYKAYQ
jgi:hypothetical protein